MTDKAAAEIKNAKIIINRIILDVDLNESDDISLILDTITSNQTIANMIEWI